MNHEPEQCIDSVAAGSAAEAFEGRREELALLAGGDLPPEEAGRLEEHARGCPACRHALAGLREGLAGLALLAADDLGPERPAERAALDRVRAGVRAGAARIESERSAGGGSASDAEAGGRLRWALAAALLVALLGAASWLRSGLVSEAGDAPPERVAEHSARPPVPPAEPESPPERTVSEAPASPGAADRIDPIGRTGRIDPIGRTDRPDPTGGPGRPVGEPGSAPAVPRSPTEEPTDSPSAPSAPIAEERPAEPRITIRIVSDDPDIVFYWLVEPEENRDETVSS